MNDDLGAILGGASAAPSDAPTSYDPTEAALRTIYAEASPKAGPNELRAIASVVANRAKAGGQDVGAVVRAPGQFESWKDTKGRERIAAAPEEELSTIHDLVGGILSGEEDPTTDATHFYAPVAQAAKAPVDGRPVKPVWDDGSGQQIGDHMFVRVGPSTDLSAVLGGAAPVSPSADAELTAEHLIDPMGTAQPGFKTKLQEKAIETLMNGRALDADAPLGSIRHPYLMGPDDKPEQGPAGAYYLDQKGKLGRVPGGDKQSSFAAGVGQGMGDVATTLGNILPGAGDSEILNRLRAGQMAYDATYGGDTKSGIGRFTGQVLTSAPLMATGEGLLAPAVRALGPTGEFLAGRGGAAMVNGLPRFGVRVASLAAHGAAQGAEGAALTSSASDAPLPEQLAEGAAGGAIMGQATPAVRAGGKWVGGVFHDLTKPLTAGGRGEMVDRLLGEVKGAAPLVVDDRELVPGSQPTLGPASANAGVATVERNARANPRLAERFAERDAQNNRARLDFLDRLRGDDDSITDLKDTREAATKTARETALASQSAPADIAPVVAKIDAILAGPEGKRSEVVKALNAVKDNLYDAGGKPETDASMLYGVRKDLNDLLDPRASSDRKGAQLASSQLQDVRGELDKAIEAVAPGFKDYLKTYAEHSRPIDEQNFLQSQKLVDSKGMVTLSRVQSTLDRIDGWRRKPGANPAKSISDDTYKALTDLRDDLKRAGQIDLGKARGSDTHQNFVTGNIADRMSVPLSLGAGVLTHNPLAGAAVVGGKMFYGSKNKQVLDALGERLLMMGPTGAPAAPPPKPPGRVGTVLKRVGQTALPAGAGILLNSLTTAGR